MRNYFPARDYYMKCENLKRTVQGEVFSVIVMQTFVILLALVSSARKIDSVKEFVKYRKKVQEFEQSKQSSEALLNRMFCSK